MKKRRYTQISGKIDVHIKGGQIAKAALRDFKAEPIDVYDNGDADGTGATSDAYRDGWDRVFGGRRKEAAN